MSSARRLALALALLLVAARADAEPARALFALVIGANQSIDTELPALQYADDDAARYLDLFRSLGAKTYLLTRPDENTSRVHPQAVAEAQLPRQKQLALTAALLAAELVEARVRKVKTVFYFVFAGHGSVRDGRGYIALEDARLDGTDLERLIDQIGADQSHLIIDSCFSYYLAFQRGPGGQRREARGFSRLEGLAQRPSVGLLLSTSSARESHEWERFQSGVFSYEVRAGLYGAADLDGDGQVSYREIAAFVSRANQAIANERYRPDVYARPPQGDGALVDLRTALPRRLDIDGAQHGHYLLEDSRGVRLAEFHNGALQPLHLLRPTTGGALYLRRLDGNEREWALPAMPDVLALADLEAAPPRVAMRGAAHEAFSTIFSLPFDASALSGVDVDAVGRAQIPRRWHQRVALALLGAGALTVGGGIGALATAPGAPPGTASQLDVLRYNESQQLHGAIGWTFFGVGVASMAIGGVLLLHAAHHAPSGERQ